MEDVRPGEERQEEHGKGRSVSNRNRRVRGVGHGPRVSSLTVAVTGTATGEADHTRLPPVSPDVPPGWSERSYVTRGAPEWYGTTGRSSSVSDKETLDLNFGDFYLRVLDGNNDQIIRFAGNLSLRALNLGVSRY